jgi:hypothetical protein
MPDGDFTVRRPKHGLISGTRAHHAVIHSILNHDVRLTSAERALLDRLSQEEYISQQDWIALDALWERLEGGR